MDGLNVNSNNTREFCNIQHEQFIAPKGELWCNPVWDTLLCWPPTRASMTAKQGCPFVNGFDTTKSIEKKCGDSGFWEGQNSAIVNDSSFIGWANYSTCLTPEMLRLHYRIYNNNVNGEMIMKIAEKTRTMEFIGLSFSLVALFASLIIFCRYRSLRNTRTKIHQNLFIAMIIQLLIRLILYIDLAIFREETYSVQRGIGNTPVLCEISYALFEYMKTAMFMWMFIEGFYLHNVVIVTVFQRNAYYGIYQFVGWGCPALMTLIWSIVMTFYYYPKSKFLRCWSGYNLSSYFWILEGPRYALILLNLLFLLNIIKVLVSKLRESHTNEIEQYLKATRAVVILLPLLGITNVLFMIEPPLDNVRNFAMWSYSTYFLQSFQGLFIATVYCFMNGEVKLALDKSITVHQLLRLSNLQIRRQAISRGRQSQPPVILLSEIEREKMEEEEIKPVNFIRLFSRDENNTLPNCSTE